MSDPQKAASAKVHDDHAHGSGCSHDHAPSVAAAATEVQPQDYHHGSGHHDARAGADTGTAPADHGHAGHNHGDSYDHAHGHAHTAGNDSHGPAGHLHDHDHGDEDGGCGHDHGPGGHHHAPTVTNKNEKVVLIGFLLTFGFMFAEVIGGLLSGSLALIADAGHMLTDAAALALAWAGFRFGRRALDAKRTFGYMRFEVLAGFVNAVSLILLVGWIAYEAIERLITPGPVLAGPMLAVAVLGLAVNGLVFFMLMQGDRDHVNIKGAMVHVLGDLLGSVAAIFAAIMIYFTGWTQIDPILSVLLSVIVLRSAWALLKHSMHILMEGTPSHVDPEAMRRDLVAAVDGLQEVNHIHVWSITSGQATATMNVVLEAGADPAVTVGRLKSQLAAEFKIMHSTVEIDWTGTGEDCSMAKPTEAASPHGHHGHGHPEHAPRRKAVGHAH